MRGGGRKILRSLERGLQAEDYEVVTAVTGEDGYELAVSQSFDCMILDTPGAGRSQFARPTRASSRSQIRISPFKSAQAARRPSRLTATPVKWATCVYRTGLGSRALVAHTTIESMPAATSFWPSGANAAPTNPSGSTLKHCCSRQV
jgi:hypothetical protein